MIVHKTVRVVGPQRRHQDAEVEGKNFSMQILRGKNRATPEQT